MTPPAASRSPARCTALLRAINVGGHVVKMQVLRQAFESLGLTGVETFIASGNVLFDAPRGKLPALEQRIERLLHETLGYEVATFLRTPAEMAAAATLDAFPGTAAGEAGYPLYVAFTRVPPTPEATSALLACRTDIDDFHINGREIYWMRRTSLGESKFTGARLERIIGMPATARNITTVRKLAGLVDALH